MTHVGLQRERERERLSAESDPSITVGHLKASTTTQLSPDSVHRKCRIRNNPELQRSGRPVHDRPVNVNELNKGSRKGMAGAQTPATLGGHNSTRPDPLSAATGAATTQKCGTPPSRSAKRPVCLRLHACTQGLPI